MFPHGLVEIQHGARAALRSITLSSLDGLPDCDSAADMKRNAFAIALLTISTLTFARVAWADDLKAMEGTWKVESAEAGGKKLDSEDLKEIEVKITGERYTVRIKDKLDAGTLKLDETKTPKAMDATDTEGDDVGKVVKAIYELSGDTLKVCYTLDGGERPTEMATKEGSPVLMFIYKREKKAE